MKGSKVMVKKHEVAISKDGKIAKCRVVDEKELQELQAESDKVFASEKVEKEKMLETIQHLEDEIDGLKQEIKVLKGED